MAITYEETVQAMLNLLRRAEEAEARVKELEAELAAKHEEQEE